MQAQNTSSRNHICENIGMVAGILALCISCAASAAPVQMTPGPILSRGLTDARPFSAAWLEYWDSGYPPNPDGARLLVDISKPGPDDSDDWSLQTEAQLRLAIGSDDLLSKNTWSFARCSRNGCIAALEPLDVALKSSVVTTSNNTDYHIRSDLLIGRLLTHIKPRWLSPRPRDLSLLEVDGSQYHVYLILFIFPESETLTKLVPNTPPSGSALTISPVIENEMTLANRALSANQWTTAIEHLTAAEATAGLSAFDKKSIYENKAFAYERAQDFLSAEDAYESAMPFVLGASTKDALEITRRILFLAQINKDYSKAIEAGRKLMEVSAADARDMAAVSSAYLQLHDCKYAIKWATKSSAQSERLGESPEISLQDVVSSCPQTEHAAK
jgi:tetratricopeptide (TPR) repeat protein